jgi:hypothetical protein
MTRSSSIVRTVRLRRIELAVDHDGVDVRRLTVVGPRRHDPARRHEVGPLGVQHKKVCLLPDLERPEELSLPYRSRTALRCVFEHVFRLQPKAGFASLRDIRSVSSATLLTSNKSFVLLSVPFAIGQPGGR